MENLVSEQFKKLPNSVHLNIKQHAMFKDDDDVVLLIWFKDGVSNEVYTDVVKHFEKLDKSDKICVKLYNYNNTTRVLKYVFGGKNL